MAPSEMFVGLVIGFVKLISGLFLSMGAIYVGLKMFDRMTGGINEMEEIKNGNAAVGIMMAAVVISIATVIQKGVEGFGSNISFDMSPVLIAIGLFVSIANLAFGVIVAILAIYLALWMLDKITVDINETEEFKQGNVAIAIMEAGVLIAVSFVIQAALHGITDSSFMNPVVIADAIGVS